MENYDGEKSSMSGGTGITIKDLAIVKDVVEYEEI